MVTHLSSLLIRYDQPSTIIVLALFLAWSNEKRKAMDYHLLTAQCLTIAGVLLRKPKSTSASNRHTSISNG